MLETCHHKQNKRLAAFCHFLWSTPCIIGQKKLLGFGPNENWAAVVLHGAMAVGGGWVEGAAGGGGGGGGGVRGWVGGRCVCT
jgi:hypothetical protein